jgi:hypothetical protein
MNSVNAATGLGPQITQHFEDGKWHAVEDIFAKVDAPTADIRRTLELMRQRGTYGCKAQRKRVAPSFAYRIFKQEKTARRQIRHSSNLFGRRLFAAGQLSQPRRKRLRLIGASDHLAHCRNSLASDATPSQ